MSDKTVELGLELCREQFEEWWREEYGDNLFNKAWAERIWQAAWNRRSGEGEQVKTLTDSMFGDEPSTLDDCLNRWRLEIGAHKALRSGVEKALAGNEPLELSIHRLLDKDGAGTGEG